MVFGIKYCQAQPELSPSLAVFSILPPSHPNPPPIPRESTGNQWNTPSMEDDINGRQTQWKTSSMEDDLNGR